VRTSVQTAVTLAILVGRQRAEIGPSFIPMTNGIRQLKLAPVGSKDHADDRRHPKQYGEAFLECGAGERDKGNGDDRAQCEARDHLAGSVNLRAHFVHRQFATCQLPYADSFLRLSNGGPQSCHNEVLRQGRPQSRHDITYIRARGALGRVIEGADETNSDGPAQAKLSQKTGT